MQCAVEKKECQFQQWKEECGEMKKRKEDSNQNNNKEMVKQNRNTRFGHDCVKKKEMRKEKNGQEK